MGNDEIDVVIENWGHDDLKKKYIEDQGIAQEAGSTGNVGIIGWYVPPWMAEEYPDITDWKNLNKYADMFQTSESGDKGQLLDGDPSFVTNDEALVKNLDLNYEVVYAGSEAALIQAFRQAEANKEPLIGYFYEPQWFMAEVPLVKVDLPPYKPGCDADPEKVACDYPEYDLDKIVATDFAKSGSPGLRPGEELPVDQRRPERRGEVHRRRRDGPGGGRRRSGSRRTRTRSTPGSSDEVRTSRWPDADSTG